MLLITTSVWPCMFFLILFSILLSGELITCGRSLHCLFTPLGNTDQQALRNSFYDVTVPETTLIEVR